MGTKLKFEFDGFENLTKRLANLEGDVKATTEKALKECHRQVTNDALQAIKPHRDTGVSHSIQNQKLNGLEHKQVFQSVLVLVKVVLHPLC